MTIISGSMPARWWIILTAAPAAANGIASLPPGSSCDAAFATPCARMTSRWLSETVASLLRDDSPGVMKAVLRSISEGDYDRDSGFRPFLFDRDTGECVAGLHPKLVGLTMRQIFDLLELSAHSDPDALHERFAASDGGWVSYLWSDRIGFPRSKVAYVISNISDPADGRTYYLGVGYKNEPLPLDLPCSDRFDRWCSLTNVRSLVGKALSEFTRADSTEDFEGALHQISYNKVQNRVDGGFYLFVYGFDGTLRAHGVLRGSFGRTLSQIFVDKDLGTAEEGLALHETFRNAVSGDHPVAWVRYPWRDDPGGDAYEKVALLVRVEFNDKAYYAGAGFRLEAGAFLAAPLGEVCSDQYNLPCSFRTAHQLSSHTLASVLSSPMSLNATFRAISRDAEFKHGDFYVFMYSVEGERCLAHGGDESYVGMTLYEIFQKVGIPLNGTRLFDQFSDAAAKGGGWVEYDWVNLAHPEQPIFKKISYIFQLTVDGEDYYGGVGFGHLRSPLEQFSDSGLKQNGDPIPCSSKFGLACSETNARAILGQALAELTLSSSEASYVETIGTSKEPIEEVFGDISRRHPSFSFNDFSVAVFSFDDNVGKCHTRDGSGCAVAYGPNPNYAGRTWNEILELEGASTIPGNSVHQGLIDASKSGTGVFTYPYEAARKRAWVAQFRHDGESYYVIADYLTAVPGPTCFAWDGTNGCPSGMACTRRDQTYCEPEALASVTRDPAFVTVLALLILLLLLSIPAAVCLVRHERRVGREKLRRAVEEREGRGDSRREEGDNSASFRATSSGPLGMAVRAPSIDSADAAAGPANVDVRPPSLEEVGVNPIPPSLESVDVAEIDDDPQPEYVDEDTGAPTPFDSGPFEDGLVVKTVLLRRVTIDTPREVAAEEEKEEEGDQESRRGERVGNEGGVFSGLAAELRHGEGEPVGNPAAATGQISENVMPLQRQDTRVTEAYPVVEEVVVAEPSELAVPWWMQTRVRLLFSAVFIVVLALAIALGVIVSSYK